jgi:hypothetical protein
VILISYWQSHVELRDGLSECALDGRYGKGSSEEPLADILHEKIQPLSVRASPMTIRPELFTDPELNAFSDRYCGKSKQVKARFATNPVHDQHPADQ